MTTKQDDLLAKSLTVMVLNRVKIIASLPCTILRVLRNSASAYLLPNTDP